MTQNRKRQTKKETYVVGQWIYARETGPLDHSGGHGHAGAAREWTAEEREPLFAVLLPQ